MLCRFGTMRHVIVAFVLLLVTGPGRHVTSHETSADALVDRDTTAHTSTVNPGKLKVIGELLKLAKEQASHTDNQYLGAFLRRHLQPHVKLDNGDFVLAMGPQFKFNPNIRMAPLRTRGEPWPLPQEYHSDPQVVLHVNQTFRLHILNKTCAILQRAVDRYSNIIKQYTLEEPYDMVYNFNDRVRRKQDRVLHVTPETARQLGRVTVDVQDVDAGYPHLGMDESYNLTVEEGSGTIVARQVWGALRALETFSQLIFRSRRDGKLYIRRTIIKDYPRFPHRGIMVDTSRHFIHIDTLKDVLEAMSYNKMNVLHWHIVDDNSFPYESKVYPKLSEKGAYHPSLVYTLDDIRDLVEFARERGIRVLPEFDTPGHMFAWLGYPEIKATCFYGNTSHEGPVGPIDPSKDESYEFLANLFREIYSVFSDRFVHLGGDELMDTCWATNPSIVAYLEKNAGIPASEATDARGYVDKALGYYFTRLIQTLTGAAVSRSVANTSFVLWEDVVNSHRQDVVNSHRQIPKDAILQVWMGGPARVKTLNYAGYQTIYSSCWYLDQVTYGMDWTKYYRCEPSPYTSAEEERDKLLGGEACLWAEYITSETLMTHMWPRSSAVAERLWSNRSVTDVQTAARRLQEQRCRMISRGLPVGHTSGPDYCLRQGSRSPPDRRRTAQYVYQHGAIGVAVMPKYSNYLPILNLGITFAGVSMILVSAGIWRRRRHNSRVPRSP